MNVYIHRRAKFFVRELPLDPRQFGLGYTLEDYCKGKFVRLNNDQTYFWQTHPGCTPIEAFNMILDADRPVIDPEPFVSGSVEE